MGHSVSVPWSAVFRREAPGNAKFRTFALCGQDIVINMTTTRILVHNYYHGSIAGQSMPTVDHSSQKSRWKVNLRHIIASLPGLAQKMYPSNPQNAQRTTLLNKGSDVNSRSLPISQAAVGLCQVSRIFACTCATRSCLSCSSKLDRGTVEPGQKANSKLWVVGWFGAPNQEIKIRKNGRLGAIVSGFLRS